MASFLLSIAVNALFATVFSKDHHIHFPMVYEKVYAAKKYVLPSKFVLAI